MDRRVKMTKRDRDGNIIALCNPGEPWSPRKTADIVKDIRAAKTSYYVMESGKRAYVRLIPGSALETTADESSKNNLNNLPTA
jgi:hypothetical protein